MASSWCRTVGGLQRNIGTHPRVVVANKTVRVMLPVKQPIRIDKGSFLLITERKGHQLLSVSMIAEISLVSVIT